MQSTELTHYGVKGMRWGIRRNRNNEDYTGKQRKRDQALYGKRAEKRINRKMNEGHGVQGARHYEVERKERNEKLKKKLKNGAKKTAGVLAKVGQAYVTDKLFFGGMGTAACKEAIRVVGMASITAFTMARGGYDIKWYDKAGNRVG